MGTLIYDETSFTEFKNNVNTANSDILESLTKINKELETLDTTINTPNSNKSLLIFNEYLNDRTNYINTCKEGYNSYFDGVINIYRENQDVVKDMVGDRND